jgi:hypothetical protein
MSAPQFREAAEAFLVPMTEAQLASEPWEPRTIVQHRGRYWQEAFPGLFEPIHLMARLSAEEATRPALRCWGYHATLAESSAAAANGSAPIHLLADVDSYGVESLSANRRYHLRRSQRQTRLVQLSGVGLLEREGYEVFESAQARTGNPYRTIRSKAEFLAQMEWFATRPSAIILAGLVDDRLGGWIAGYAVDDTAYIEVVDVATEVLSTHISTGLHFAFVEACRRSGTIRRVAHSPHIPEDAALARFKEGIGFPVVRVPSKVWLLPPAAPLIRWRKPFLYYRLTGSLRSGPDASL